jgi:hypothetical protein
MVAQAVGLLELELRLELERLDKVAMVVRLQVLLAAVAAVLVQ